MLSPILSGLWPVLLLTPLSLAAPVAEPSHSATNRAYWEGTYTINTDYEVVDPPAGVTRVYDLTITNVTDWVGPDGVTKPAMLINGQFPGPTIFADWGDYLNINVHNQLQDNGTALHWHGIRQLQSNEQDGANGITECPIPPGHTRTYSFHLTQYGTSWYHSHFAAQYANGVIGTIQINGPASANYDTDLGVYPITDYYHDTADRNQLKAQLVSNGPPPSSDNILFNGTNINPLGPGGEYNRVTLTPGKKHRLRLINPSVEHAITVSMVGHTFTVIQTDFVPVEPVEKTSLFMGIGQRYDVIIEADQKVDNYWFNVTLASSGLCGHSNNNYPAAIFSYEGAPSGLPTNPGTPIAAGCADTLGFTPVVTREAPQDQFTPNEKFLDVSLDTPTIGGEQVFRWQVNGSSIDVQWDKPILEYVATNNNSFPTNENVIEVPDANVWTWWVIQNTGVVPHPIHLHGHDFLFLGSAASSTFDPVTSLGNLTFSNPIRRDAAMLPSNGWLAIAFQTNNPGAWLMHCHIAWHVSQGLAVQFLERESDISQLNLNDITPNCDAWRAYEPTMVYQKDDSGL